MAAQVCATSLEMDDSAPATPTQSSIPATSPKRSSRCLPCSSSRVEIVEIDLKMASTARPTW